MHPLDSSLDASLHDQPYKRRAIRRRSSIDNGCLVASNDDLILKLMVSNNSVDENHHSPLARLPRRRSLNNVNAMPTTFLAGYSGSKATKGDLDLDCHSSLHESRQAIALAANNNNNGSSSYGSSTKLMSSFSWDANISHGNASSNNNSNCHEATTPTAVSDDNVSVDNKYNDDDYDDDDDSFCDASYAEPANQEYIQKDLGASCIWNDDVDDNDNIYDPQFAFGQQQQGSCSIQEPMSQEDIDYYYNSAPEEKELEPGAGVGRTNDHSMTARASDDDAHSMLLMLLQGQQQQQGEPRQQQHPNNNKYEHHDDDKSLTGGFGCDDFYDDNDSTTGSFCDADDFEHANREYLKTDLGASVFWNSADMTDDITGSLVAGDEVETITEEIMGDHS